MVVQQVALIGVACAPLDGEIAAQFRETARRRGGVERQLQKDGGEHPVGQAQVYEGAAPAKESLLDSSLRVGVVFGVVQGPDAVVVVGGVRNRGGGYLAERTGHV